MRCALVYLSVRSSDCVCRYLDAKASAQMIGNGKSDTALCTFTWVFRGPTQRREVLLPF